MKWCVNNCTSLTVNRYDYTADRCIEYGHTVDRGNCTVERRIDCVLDRYNYTVDRCSHLVDRCTDSGQV